MMALFRLKDRSCSPWSMLLLVIGGYAILQRTDATNDISIDDIVQQNKPFLLYGTAWKKEDTAMYVNQAVHAGFRFIDTACQPKHYNEPGVGFGWTSAAFELGLKRKDFFLQTKYTSINGQDRKRIPYDQHSSLEEQIQQSLEISLKNLKTDYLDSLILHGPERDLESTIRAYRVLESFVDQGMVHHIGISNVYGLDWFTAFYERVRIKPKVLQNHLHPDDNHDVHLRAFCSKHNIWYQSFWTLTANHHLIERPAVYKIAKKHNLTPQTLFFAFLMSLGDAGEDGKRSSYMRPLSGAKSPNHLADDVDLMKRMLAGETFFATKEELAEFSQLIEFPDKFDNVEEEEL
mmetsp:Transcript_32868/g.50286  ORF Transcript_32868/g.50286 Transcript_32868/m.50286 type:complete len:347 (-) Transcript_32868:125-1165(-)